jgi:hypothetical protein
MVSLEGGTEPVFSAQENAPRRKEWIVHGRTAEHLFHPACKIPSFSERPSKLIHHQKRRRTDFS